MIATGGFHQACLNKLQDKEAQGYEGWDDAQIAPDEYLKMKLNENILAEDWVDVANFAMMLWDRQKKEAQCLGNSTSELTTE